jgi:GntR family transcriptional regulator, uxu operon transcriptional repressor
MSNTFSPLPPPWEEEDLAHSPVTSAVKSLAAELYARITSSRYSYGTRLPAERQFADEFKVSRNTVRHALDLLESSQIISRRAGSGSFVTFREAPSTEMSQPNPSSKTGVIFDDVAEATSPLELNVVRTIIEPETVRLAIINMSPRDIVKLEKILVKLEAVTTDAQEFSRWDVKFHLQIAEGTHNPLLIAIYRHINHVRAHAHWTTTKVKTLSPNRIRDYQKKHRSIFEAIEARDIESAVEFVKLHMMEVQRDLMSRY